MLHQPLNRKERCALSPMNGAVLTVGSASPAGPRRSWTSPGPLLVGDTVRFDDLMTVWDEALCAQVDPELFFPEQGDGVGAQAARKICRRCGVQELCGQVFGPLLSHGIVGGQSAGERARTRRVVG
ncbi:transcription factor WhiB [Candidatus Protofrankia californiensis]|uniref:Transcription factor WhiB n=1 Tax=Candidatus Protofrankia californiensis TaxID=1839754 RepID=A0A1C3NWM0_9ACTN|nr:transcription factor WhiB [Candidatus Protofrankia californiensis]